MQTDRLLFKKVAFDPPVPEGLVALSWGESEQDFVWKDHNGVQHTINNTQAAFSGEPINATQATLTVYPSGSDNIITYTAVEYGVSGHDISIAYTAPVQAALAVSVANKAITVACGTKHRMVVTGTLTSNGATPVVFDDLGFHSNTTIGGVEYPQFGDAVGFTDFCIPTQSGGVWNGWRLAKGVAAWTSPDLVDSPELCTTWEPVDTETGTPVVIAALPTAQQVIDAIEASVAASALVTPVADGAVTGAVAAVSAAHLAGAVNGTPAKIGRMAGEGADAWIACSEDNTVTQHSWMRLLNLTSTQTLTGEEKLVAMGNIGVQNAWDQNYDLEAAQQENLRLNARARHRVDRETILVRSVGCLTDPSIGGLYTHDIAFHRMPPDFAPGDFAVNEAETNIADYIVPLVDHSFPWFFAYAYSPYDGSGWIEQGKPYFMLAVVSGAWMIVDLIDGVAYRGHRAFGPDQGYSAIKNDPWDVTWNQQSDVPGPFSWEAIGAGSLSVLDDAPPGYPFMTAWPGGPAITPVRLRDTVNGVAWSVRVEDYTLNVRYAGEFEEGAWNGEENGGISVWMHDNYAATIAFGYITGHRFYTAPDRSGTIRVSGDTNYIAATSTTLTLANNLADVFTLMLKASTSTAVTLPAPTDHFREFRMIVKQPAATGNGAATFPGVKWPGGTAPTITTAAGKADILRFISDGTVWFGSVIAQNYTP